MQNPRPIKSAINRTINKPSNNVKLVDIASELSCKEVLSSGVVDTPFVTY